MPIPKADSAFIPPEKLTDYLLNESHPVGGSKARWFRVVGYDLKNPDVLGDDLLALVRSSEDYSESTSAYGTKYVVSGVIVTPTGRRVSVTTVWIGEPEGPRLVTAYPGER